MTASYIFQQQCREVAVCHLVCQSFAQNIRTLESSFKLCKKLIPLLGFLRHRHPCRGKRLLDAVPWLQGEMLVGFRTFRSSTERSFTLKTYTYHSIPGSDIGIIYIYIKYMIIHWPSTRVISMAAVPSRLPLRFFVGFGFGLGQPSAVAILMEISPTRHRPINQATRLEEIYA